MKLKGLLLPASLGICAMLAIASDLPKLGKSRSEVRTLIGAPTEIRASAGGEEVWEYAGKPSPYQNYFLTFAKDGTLREIKPVINDAAFSKIKVGSTTEARVRELLGTPWRTTNYGDCHPVDFQEIWEYRGQDSGGTYKLQIEFDEGGIARIVVKTPDKGRPIVLAAAPSQDTKHQH